MAETKYRQDSVRFNYTGIDLNRPPDSMKPGKLRWVKNMRSTTYGELVPRAGLTLIGTPVSGQTPLHSVRRLNDPANSTWTRVIGAGTHVAYGQTSFTDLDSGYSGDPLALVPWRLESSPSPFMYVADRSRMRKVGLNGALHTVGLAHPPAAPAVAPAAPSYKVVDGFQATTGWTQSGTAGAPALLSAGPGYRASTTISQIIYDISTTGWCSIQPASMANIGQGCRLNLNPGGGADEFVTVQAVYPGSLATTIGAVSYDSGTSGLCSIAIATSPFTLHCDAIIRNTTLSENARIVGVVYGPNGTASIRVSTSGTWAATNAITVLPTIRTYTTNNHAAAETMRIDGVRTACTAGTAILTKTSALDLSLIATGVPSQPDDYMHISFRVSDPTVITEIKAQLDVDIATNDFTRNYFWKSFRPDDLTLGAANLQSLLAAKQTLIQKAIIDAGAYVDNNGIIINSTTAQNLDIPTLMTPLKGASVIDLAAYQQQAANAAAQQFASGASQWAELRFRLSDLIRIGSDGSRTLQNVAALRLVFLVTGSVNIDIDSWWIGGGTGPDTGSPTASPLHYRFRARHPGTNVASNFSPATRYDATPLRQTMTITPTQYAAPSGTSLSATDFVLDIERFGGDLPEWKYIATIPNASSPSYTDVLSDLAIAGNPSLGQTNYQPWPIIGAPVTGTTGTVAGTTVNDAATNFSASWAPGTRILINNIPYTIYRVISTSKLELMENAGAQSSVVWRIDEPVILAQPLPCLWEDDNYLIGCGDPVNPGRLYYTNRGSETTGTRNYCDITAPSEPLQNGRVYNVRSYVWSTGNLFQLIRTSDPSKPFRWEQIPGGKGLFSRWAVVLGPTPQMFWMAADGIYASTGGEPVSLTDADLYPLFPNEGNPGITSEPYPGITTDAPDVTSSSAAKLRLAMAGEWLYFDYPPIGATSSRRTLLLAFDAGSVSRGESAGGWLYDIFSPNVTIHYAEEGSGINAILTGGTDGKLYQYAGASDNGTAIACGLLTESRDQGEARERKLYGDVMLDANCDGVNILATPLINNNTVALASSVLSTAIRTQSILPGGAAWTSAKNISVLIEFSVGGAATITITSGCPSDDAVPGVTFTYTMTADGTPPYVWSLVVPPFEKSCTFSVDHTKVPANLSDVPVLAYITDPSLKSIANGGNVMTGLDFAVVDNGGSLLPFRIKYWDPSGGVLAFHTKMDISSSVDIPFRLVWSNSGCLVDLSDPAAFNDYYDGYWPLGTYANAASADNTANAGNAIVTGSNPALIARVSTASGGGIDYNASAALQAPFIEALALSNSFSIGLVVTFDTLMDTSATWPFRNFINRAETTAASSPRWIFSWKSDDAKLTFHFNLADGTQVSVQSSVWAPSADTRYHVALVRNGASWTFYIDGVAFGTATESRSLQAASSDAPLGLGWWSASSSPIDGIEEEVWVMGSHAVSDDWMAVAAANALDAATFAVPGSVETEDTNLDIGISIDASTGEITWTPEIAGTITWTANVTDADAGTGTIDCSTDAVAIDRVRPTAHTLQYSGGSGSGQGLWLNPASFYDGNTESFATNTLAVTSPFSDYYMLFMYTWEAFSTVGLTSVTLYLDLEVSSNGNTGDNVAINLDLFDGIDDNFVHSGVAPSWNPGTLTGPNNISRVTLSATISAATWLGLSNPVVRIAMLETRTQSLNPAYVLHGYDVYLIPGY